MHCVCHLFIPLKSLYFLLPFLPRWGRKEKKRTLKCYGIKAEKSQKILYESTLTEVFKHCENFILSVTNTKLCSNT